MNRIPGKCVYTLSELQRARALMDQAPKKRKLLDIIPVCSGRFASHGKSQTMVVINEKFYCIAKARALVQPQLSEEEFISMFITYDYGQTVYPLVVLAYRAKA